MPGLHLIRQRRWRRIADLFSPVAMTPSHQAEIWRDIAEHYVSLGHIEDADAAYGYGLAVCPKAFHLRIARRRLPGRKISLCGAHRPALYTGLLSNLLLTDKPEYKFTEQIVGGTSGNTDLIARHTLECRESGRLISVIEKRLYSPKGADGSREARLAKVFSGDVGARHFRFPKVYAVLDNARERTVSVYMEDLGSFSKIVRNDEDLRRRARALGEFARFMMSNDRAGLLGDANVKQGMRPLTASDLNVFRGLVPPEVIEAACRLIRRIQATGIADEGLPETAIPSKGDANGSNLPIHRDGKVVFIDNGAAGVAPVGRDMASILSHYFQRIYFRSGNIRRLAARSESGYLSGRQRDYASLAEEIVCRGYLEGGRLYDLGVTDNMVRRGYAQYLLFSLYSKHVRPIRLRRDHHRAGSIAGSRDEAGTPLERVALKKVLQILFALDRVLAQYSRDRDSSRLLGA